MYRFTVEGSGPFPFEMLHLAQCWPLDLMDVNTLRDVKNEERRVMLLLSRTKPDVKLWQDRGWLCFDVEYE